MSLPSLASPIQARAAASLQRRFITGAAIAGSLIVLALALGANELLQSDAQRQGDARISDAARRAQIIIGEALNERSRDARVIAISPEVVSAAREGGARARSLGLPGTPIPALEQRFNADRSMQVAPATREYLRALLPQLEAAEMLLTDANGYNAVITQRSSDFVQSDEAWWQAAWTDGLSSADASFDSSAHQTVVSLASVVRDGGAKVGVVKLAFSVTSLVRSLAAAGGGIRVDLLDSANRVLISSDSASQGRTLRGMPDGREESLRPVTTGADSLAERALMLRTNSGRWRVVAHLPAAQIAAPYRMTRAVLIGATALLFGVLAVLLVAMNGFLRRRISAPATQLAEAAEAVAGGDFSVELDRSTADDEIGRLSRAVGAMIVELRRLTQTIATSAHESRVMSSEITASTEEMAASAGEIANTASDLSTQATSMAETINELATSSGALRLLAASLDAGARDGVTRNHALRTLSVEIEPDWIRAPNHLVCLRETSMPARRPSRHLVRRARRSASSLPSCESSPGSRSCWRSMRRWRPHARASMARASVSWPPKCAAWRRCRPRPPSARMPL